MAWPEVTARMEALLEGGLLPLSLRKENLITAQPA
jgi:hypothetical protein